MAKPAFPKSDTEKAKVYLHCMVEIKERLSVIQRVRSMPIQPLFAEELAFLQLRYICELIAIACLVAQCNYETQRAFREEYSPPKIFSALNEEYPHFFPQAATMSFTSGSHHLEANNKVDAYGEADVSKSWNLAGSHLHRASTTSYMKKAFSPKPISRIEKHLVGLIRLLECHIIPVGEGNAAKRLLQIDLEDGAGNVAAHWMDFDEKGGVAITSFRTSPVKL